MDTSVQKQAISDLAIPDWVEIDEVSLRFISPPDINGAHVLAGLLGQFKKALPFYIGDFLNQAEGTFGEASSQVADLFGEEFEYGTMANYKSVCARVGREARLTFPSMSHCDAVKTLPDDLQIHWLAEARSQNLTAQQLRKAIKADADGEDFEQFDDFSKKAAKEVTRLDNLAAEAPTQKQLNLVNQASELVQEAANFKEIVEGVG